MKKSKEEAKVTRDSLLRCAVRLFIEKGYENTSLAAIAEAAGVTKGAIYWHFKDKSSILDSIIELYDQEAIDHVPRIMESDISPLMKIKFLTYSYVPVFNDRKKLSNLFRLKSEISTHYRIRNRQPFAKVFLDKLESLFTLAKESGEVRKDADAHITALTVILIITGTYIKYDTNPDFFQKLGHISDIMDNYFALVSTAKGAIKTKSHRELAKQMFPELLVY